MASIRKLSVVIPAYNEGQSIRNVLGSLVKELANLKVNHEIIVVNDGSTDRTKDAIEKFRGKVMLIDNPYNKGYGASLKTGIRASRGDYILIMDADGQHKPEDIKRLLRYADFDMVVGARKKGFTPRGVGKKILSTLANYLAETKIPDLNAGFRLIKADVARDFLGILPNGFSFTTTITLACIKSGYNLKYVPITTALRKKGRSKVSFFGDGFNFMLLILRISMLFNPLKIFIPVFAVTFCVGLIMALYSVIYHLNISDSALLMLLSSLLIFLFGLLADQISNIRRGD